MSGNFAEVLGFTDEDLAANRAGRFSDAQLEDLELRVAYYKDAWERSWGWVDLAAKGRRAWALWMSSFSLMLVLGVAAAVRRPPADGISVLSEVLLGAVAWALMIGLVGWGLSRFIRAHRPRDELLLQCAEGTARHASEESGGWGADILLVLIGEARLPVSAEVRQCFVPGQSYRVHYVESPYVLVLSAEATER